MRLFSDVKNRLGNWWADDHHAIPRFIRDWQLDRVGLYTLTFNPVTECYHLDYIHVCKKDLDPRAVHLTGSGESEYYLDLVDTGEYPKPNYMTATDLYLYMINNDISDALTNKRKTPIILDTKTAGLIVIAIIGVAAFIIYKVFM